MNSLSDIAAAGQEDAGGRDGEGPAAAPGSAGGGAGGGSPSPAAGRGGAGPGTGQRGKARGQRGAGPGRARGSAGGPAGARSGVQHLSFGFFQRQSPKPNSIMLVCAQSWATAQPGHWRGLTGGWGGKRGRKERFWDRQWGSPSQCTQWSCTNLAEVTQTSKAGQSQPPQHTAPQGTGLFRGEKRHPSFSAVCSSKMYFQLNCKSLQSPSPGSSLGTGECSVRVLLSWCPTPNRDSESRGDFSPAQSPALQVGLTRLCLAGRIQG